MVARCFRLMLLALAALQSFVCYPMTVASGRRSVNLDSLGVGGGTYMSMSGNAFGSFRPHGLFRDMLVSFETSIFDSVRGRLSLAGTLSGLEDPRMCRVVVGPVELEKYGSIEDDTALHPVSRFQVRDSFAVDSHGGFRAEIDVQPGDYFLLVPEAGYYMKVFDIGRLVRANR